MILTEFSFDALTGIKAPDDRPRTTLYVHVSHIIRDISNSIIHVGKRLSVADLTDVEKARMGNYCALGFSWERILESALEDAFLSGSVIRPGELVLDGIAGTPDLVDLEGEGVLEEWKCTWRSSRRAERLEEDFIEWFWQIKAYLKLTGLRRARLRVFFVNGNYRNSGPQIKCWDIQFTQHEINENWNMLKGHAQRKGWL